MALEIHYNVFGCFREPRADVELAKRAVEAGFGGVWIGDHFHPWIDSRPYAHHVLPWFGTLMAEVPDVPVGTSVTCPMMRYRPPVLAQAIATLDNMYPDRFNLGVGTGEALNEAHFMESWPDWSTRADMLVESIEVMENLWDGGWVSHDGEYFQYDDIKLYTSPKADIPIHWAGWGPRSCQRAGRHADHLITAASPEAIADRIVPNLERGLDDIGRDPATVDVTTELEVNVGDPTDLVAAIRERGEHIPISERHESDPRTIQETASAELAGMSDEEIREEKLITDDPAAIVERLEALEAAGATRVLVGTSCGDPHETIGTFEEEILPEFR